MRVLGGNLVGRALAAPAGRGTRPTPALVRAAIFDALAARAGPAPLVGWNVVDLYAGTGALGIEALSRGCARAWLVESGAPALAVLRRNVAELGLAARAQVVPAPVARFLASGAIATIMPRLILADPPYRVGAQGTLAALAAIPDLPRDVWVVLQHPTGEELRARSGTLTCCWARPYGATSVSMFVWA